MFNKNQSYGKIYTYKFIFRFFAYKGWRSFKITDLVFRIISNLDNVSIFSITLTLTMSRGFEIHNLFKIENVNLSIICDNN